MTTEVRTMQMTIGNGKAFKSIMLCTSGINPTGSALSRELTDQRKNQDPIR